ncbi:MAG: NAD-dependent epimerase/dehydratase family protein, partial [Deltaproteobacteria bacterium]
MRSFLVTGADGLLGSHIVRELLDAGHAVRVLVQAGSASPTLDGLEIARVTGDLLDPASLAAAVRGCDRVVHAAAITDIGAGRERTFAVNVDGTRNVVDACLAEGVGRLVFVGSASAHGFGSLESPGDETSPFPDAHRGMVYAESKHAAAELVRDAVAARGLDAVLVAPTFMLGDHDWRPSSGEMLRQYLERGVPAVPPGGRNFANAADVARGIVAAAERGERGETYLLGGENLTYGAFFEEVARHASASPPRWVLPGPVVLGFGAAGSLLGKLGGKAPELDLPIARAAVVEAFYSSAKAERELGYVRTPIALGIASELGALRRFGHLREAHAGDLAGQVALVTGASRGVGLATAREL